MRLGEITHDKPPRIYNGKRLVRYNTFNRLAVDLRILKRMFFGMMDQQYVIFHPEANPLTTSEVRTIHAARMLRVLQEQPDVWARVWPNQTEVARRLYTYDMRVEHKVDVEDRLWVRYVPDLPAQHDTALPMTEDHPLGILFWSGIALLCIIVVAFSLWAVS